ncbi:SDR family NAD(P)-dependent oxidoreductase [Rhodococcus sp. NPDC058521]|uniref:SDR family NAD(P)-dependent oxidoreductase n=1 Tax=Rhodococcus sp. NPDC058521 TaxID=3346536 RepID=UPI0036638EC4
MAGHGALVIGGSRGIGRAIARRLAADGAAVVLTYRAQSEAAETVVKEIAEHNGHACAAQLDVAKPDQVDSAFSAADEFFRKVGVGLDVLVVNAGTFANSTISTVGTHLPSPGESVYAASKAAVEQVARVASRELGHRGITANTISLGPTDTDLLRAGAQPGAVEGAASMTPST